MREVLRTNDPATLAFAESVLRSEGIEPFLFDVNMSVLEGGIGILPRRITVIDIEVEAAIEALEAAGIADA